MNLPKDKPFFTPFSTQSILVITLTLFFLKHIDVFPWESRDNKQLIKQKFYFLRESEPSGRLELGVSHSADHLAHLSKLHFVILLRILQLIHYGHLRHAVAVHSFFFSNGNSWVFHEKRKEVFAIHVTFPRSIIPLNQTSNANNVSLQYIIHLQSVAELISIFLPRFPLVFFQDDFRHEFVHGFSCWGGTLLINVLALGNSGYDFHEFIPAKDAWVHVRDRVRVVISTNELGVDLRGCKTSHAFLIR